MKILFLAANPQSTSRLNLEKEAREIQEALDISELAREFELIQKWEVRARDFRRALLRYKPDIVHFSGHGEGESGLVIVDESSGAAKAVTGEALAGLFAEFDCVQCVLLNACYAEVQAQAIVSHVDYVIGMRDTIYDKAAIAFAIGFYDGLGYGRSAEEAFRLGSNAILWEYKNNTGSTRAMIPEELTEVESTGNLPEHLKPILLKKDNNAAKGINNQPQRKELLLTNSNWREKYRARIQKYLDERNLTPIARWQLATFAKEQGISESEASSILEEELGKREEVKETYGKLLRETISKGFDPLDTETKQDLKGLQQALKLSDKEVEEIYEAILGQTGGVKDSTAPTNPDRNIKTIKIFLASSSELQDDRQQFEIFINRKNKKYIEEGVFLKLVLWEDFIDAMSVTRLQDEYNKAVEGCDIFVSLFHTKVGKYTEEEFSKALKTFKDKDKPLIYTYFKDEAVNMSQVTPDIVSLINFRQKLNDLGHFYTKYNNVNELKYKFSEQLIKVLPKLTGVLSNKVEQASEVEKSINEQEEEEKIRQKQEAEELRRLREEVERLRQEKEAANQTNVTESVIDSRSTNEEGIKLRESEFDVVTVSLEKERAGIFGFGSKVKVNKNSSPGQAQYFTEDLGNVVGLDMVYIPGGSFMMGSPDKERKSDWSKEKESPQHKVTVQPFFMGKFQITQAQWRAIASLPKVKVDLKPEPSNFKGDELPVEQVSWDDAVEFCQRLSNATGKEYRLPSEAEWEYACRAGTITPFHFGETITGELANYDASRTYANEAEGEYRKKTTPVGSFRPNAFGLYDVHGNVWEWCEDDWHDNYNGAPTDGSAWTSGASSIKVIRGGSWDLSPVVCRSATRILNVPEFDYNLVGFRVVCRVPRTT